jgi:hypothetical protein
MSIGNLKDYGNKGNNFPWQLKMLQGQQCACDALQEIVDNINVPIRPAILREFGNVSSIPFNCFSVSFSSVGTADALISFDAGLNFVSVPAGTTINMDASGVNNFYASGQFFWDTVTNAGSELLITYNA